MGLKMNFTNALSGLAQLTGNNSKQISKKQYELFCKEFVFEKLKGNSFAESFCKKFKFNDTFLKNLSDETAKYHIEMLGYIK
jgi:hypothetical protein